MKIFLATDHTGFEIKNKVKLFLQEHGYTVEDCGAYKVDTNDDYPDFIAKAAASVSKDPDNNKGIIFGGSGQGEAMVANKFRGVRCALFYAKALPLHSVDAEGRESNDPYAIVTLTREHNFANMLSLGVRFLTDEEIQKAILLWLAASQPTKERHLRRVKKIKQLEV